MKFTIKYDSEKKRLYVSPLAGGLILGGIILVCTALIAGFFITRANNRLVNPQDEIKPISVLGKAPPIPSGIRDDVEKVGDYLADEIKKNYTNKFTIIFFYDNYSQQKEALFHIELMKGALDLVEPFKSSKDLIAFKIFTTEGEKCRVKSATEKILVCDNKLLESFQKLGIERFKLVILSEKDFLPGAVQAKGLNTWIAISTNRGTLSEIDFKRWIGLVFMRELGYSLGLKSEFTEGKATAFPEFIPPTSEELLGSSYKPGQPNCAPDLETAQKWWGNYTSIFPKVGFFKGCAGNKDYIYPQENTLMSSVPNAETYGQVSEDYLRGVLSCFYGNKEGLIFQAGKEATYSAKLNSCGAFTKDYPSFWTE